MQHKFKIDQDLLTELLTTESPTLEMIKELKKVITIVMIKHYSKYLTHKNDYESFAILAVLERKDRYDRSFGAYSYIYTICRNEIGNKINKTSRVTFVADILPISNASVDANYRAELPTEIKKFKKYLTGEEDFDVIKVDPVDAVNLSVYINTHLKLRRNSVPTFIKESPEAVYELYRIIQHL